MKRILTSILAIYSLSVGAGLPPSTISGERDSTNTVKFNLKAPNYQSTNLGGLDSRIETGNTNLLVNPSFEHTTVTTGWTITNATSSADTTNQVEGKKALSLSLTGALSVVQDSTINAANLVGLQGNASIKIKTSDVDGLKVCARNAGVTSTSLCINIPKDGVWKEINIPNILTATSNGIAITSTGTTGTVKLDDAFVGTSAPFQGVSGAKLVGTVTISGCSGAWSTSSTSFASFSTLTGCTYTTSGQAQAPSTNIPAIKFASLPAGDYRLEYEGGLGLNAASTSTTAYFQFTDGTNTAREISNYYAYNSQPISSTMSQTITYNSSQSNVTLEIKGKISGTVASAITGTTSQPGVIKVWYFPPESKIYSQASQDYDWTAYTPTFTGFGTVTNATFWHKREGSDLLIRGNFQTGTLTATTPSLTLPNGLSIDTTKIPSVVSLCSISQRGISATTGSQYTNYTAINPSTPTVLKFATGNNGLTGTNEITNATISFGNGEWQSISTCRIPIQGWQDYGVIVGSFAGIETCSSPYECTDTFSAQISSTGVISNQNIPWISSVSKGGTGIYNITYNTNLKDGVNSLSSIMNCVASIASTNTEVLDVVSSVSTGVTVNILGVASDRPFTIKCQKGTNDYKPKTAKVASSIGVPTVPGITTTGTGNLIDTFSVSYGTTNSTTVCSASPCSYLDQIGTVVSSVTRSATGTYTLNLSKTYAKLKCSYYCMGGVVCGSGQALSCSNCSTLSFNSYNTNSFTIQDSFGLLHCQGQY